MSESTTTATTVDQVTTVMVPVADQDRAIEFYTEKLGFETRADIPFGDGNRWVEVAPAGAATTVALVQPMEAQELGVECLPHPHHRGPRRRGDLSACPSSASTRGASTSRSKGSVLPESLPA